MAVVRAFCRADGEGARLRARSWAHVGDLVAWPIEPAWDQIRLISGYQLSTPRGDGNAVELNVEFSVTNEIHPGRIVNVQRLDSITFVLARDPQSDRWRILGPPHPPYVFASNVDAHTMAGLMAPESDAYESASALVWRTLRRQGAGLTYLETAQLGSSVELADESEGSLGAVALYLANGVPYHTGIVEEDGRITSATINGGVLTLPPDAFAGDLRYRRFTASPPPLPSPEPTGQPTAVPPPRLGTWDDP